ncbi:MAG: sulfur carrier protein ThiS [Actinomycetota bacterium]|jgi:sulfur carrier protein|nr:sulfur carrier protein ThiS [Actinomycetota bacterium]
MIPIVVNGSARQVDDGMSLDRLAGLLAVPAAGVAIAVNGEVVRRSDWPATPLTAGDEVEVVTAVQGG